MYNPILSPNSSLCLCPLCNFRFFLQYTVTLHLPAHQFCPIPNFPACPFLRLSSCHLPSDGIIPVILSHYRSSDANGCTANPAAGKPGPVPVPALPGSETAVPCSVMPMMHQGSQTPSRQAGGGRTGC